MLSLHAAGMTRALIIDIPGNICFTQAFYASKESRYAARRGKMEQVQKLGDEWATVERRWQMSSPWAPVVTVVSCRCLAPSMHWKSDISINSANGSLMMAGWGGVGGAHSVYKGETLAPPTPRADQQVWLLHRANTTTPCRQDLPLPFFFTPGNKQSLR